MRAIFYARTSKEDQSEYSIDRQVEDCKKYCESRNWTVVGIWKEEHSARKGKPRLVFDALFKEHWGEWDVLVVARLDRAWRHVYQALGHLKRIDSGGKSFASLREQLDTSNPWGKFVLTVLIALAELETDIIAERSRAGWRSTKHRTRHMRKWFVKGLDGNPEPGPEAFQILERIEAEGIGQVAVSLKLASTEPLYRLQRYVAKWKQAKVAGK